MLGYVTRINSNVYRHSRPVIEVDHVIAPRTGEICGNISLRQLIGFYLSYLQCLGRCPTVSPFQGLLVTMFNIEESILQLLGSTVG